MTDPDNDEYNMDNENVNADEDDSDHQVNGKDLRSEVQSPHSESPSLSLGVPSPVKILSL